MSALRRSLGLLCLLGFAASPSAAVVADVASDFQQGVEMLNRGRAQEALHAFQRVLAADPDHDTVLELWQGTDNQVFLTMLSSGGELEQVARAFMDRVRGGIRARRDDADAIRALLPQLDAQEASERRAAQYRLRADHGAFAVPYMLSTLADSSSGSRREAYMIGLQKMGATVVLPLVEALESPDATLRRTVAEILGGIGDERASAALAYVASNDPDGGVASAAAAALSSVGGINDPLAGYLALGAMYLRGEPAVLAPHLRSDVVWSWTDDGLTYDEVEPPLYGPMLASKAYEGALRSAPDSPAAQAGCALSAAVEHAAYVALGEGDSEASSAAALEVAAAGPGAMDAALSTAMDLRDYAAASYLCQSLGRSASGETPGLFAALGQRESSGLRGEAAAALGRIAYRKAAPAGNDVVAALGEAVSRTAPRIAVVVVGDADRAAAATDVLEGLGMTVYPWNRGLEALNGMQRLPGVDLVVLGHGLPDVTTLEVLDGVRANDRTSEAAVLVMHADADLGEELYGDKASAVVSAVGDLAAAGEYVGPLTGDRAKAMQLAARAAEVLAALAGAGHTDLAGVGDFLAQAVQAGGDHVVAPALHALGACGTAAQVDAIAAVLGDDGASDEERAAAAAALGEIFGREPAAADADTVAMLRSVGVSEASFDVRQHAVAALGRLSLTSELRADILNSLR